VYLAAAAKEAKTALIAHHNGINFKAAMAAATALLTVQLAELQQLIQVQAVVVVDSVLMAQVAPAAVD
jgi:hypothetical protein